MKNYILGQQNLEIRNDALLAAVAIAQLEVSKVVAESTTGETLTAAFTPATGGHLAIQEADESGTQIRELDLRGVISSMRPDMLEGPRTVEGVIAFTPKATLLNRIKGARDVMPSAKQIDAEVRDMLGSLTFVLANCSAETA